MSDRKNFGWIYTFGTTVQNRADEVIHEARTHSEALAWAEANAEAIDEPLYRPEYLAKLEPTHAEWLLNRRKASRTASPDLFTTAK